MSPDVLFAAGMFAAGVVTGAGAAVALVLHRLRRIWKPL